MSRFVLTAQLQLQAPNNVAQVVRQIQNQLNNVNVNVQVQGAAQAQRQLQQVTAQTQAATSAVDRMGRAFAVSVRRFAAFSIATRAVGLFTSTLSDAIKTAIDFEREMVRVSQVTGESLSQLRGFTKTVTNLSTSLGVASSDLVQAGQLILQAGFSAKDTEVALKTLAKAALAPNFDSLSETTEGAIAILAQFGEGVGALEKQLGSINAVAGAFAVEAGDLIDVIRRAGGVFKSSGGDLNELIALFTSVRATTRESAESIGTGLRTIFTRIQRPKTIEFLKQFGVELLDLEGRFVGPFEAVKRLSGALAGLGEGDVTFIRIAEELGGFRQIGKVLPLLQQFTVAQNALNVANKAGNSLTKDAETAQQALAIRIIKVKEEFLALIRGITETKTFQIMANTALSLASALIQIGDAIKPLLPMLATLAAVNLARGIGPFLGSFARGMSSNRTFNKGGKVHHFARGGFVPGTGNRDTVPAMLSPGEFVIRKSSVKKLGAGNLAAMNENRYADGGRAIVGATQKLKSTKKRDGKYGVNKDVAGAGNIQFDVNDGQIGAFVLTPPKGSEGGYSATQPFPFTLPAGNKYAKIAASQAGLSPDEIKGGVNAVINPATYPVFYPGMEEGKRNLENNAKYAAAAHKGFLDGISTGVNSTINSVVSQGLLDLPPGLNTNEKLMTGIVGKIQSDNQVRSTIEGYLFEAMISAFTGATAAGGKANFDFPRSAISQNKDKLGTLFGSKAQVNKLIKAEAKRSYGEVGGNIQKKLANDIINGYKGGVSLRTTGQRKHFGGIIQKFASGGEVVKRGTINYLKSDVVKAMASMGLAYDDFFKKIPTPNSAFSQFMVGGQGPDAKPFPKTLLPYSPTSETQLAMERGEAEKNARIQSALERQGRSMREYEGQTREQKAYMANRSFMGRRRFATGGGVGTDTVPALLTPGEFVINRSSAQRIGYGNLNRMNKVGRYAQGGIVQRFAAGTTGTGVKPKGDVLFDRIAFHGISKAEKSIAKFIYSLDSITGGGLYKLGIGLQFLYAKVTGTATASTMLQKSTSVLNSVLPDFTKIIEQNSKVNKRSRAKHEELITVIGNNFERMLKSGQSQQEIAKAANAYANALNKNTALLQQGATLPQIAGSQPSRNAPAQRGSAPSTQTNNTGGNRGMAGVVSDNKMFAASMAASLVQGFLPAIEENSSATLRLTHSFLGLVTTITSVGFALEAFGVKLGKGQMMDFLQGGGLGKRSLAGMRGGLTDMGFSKGFATKITGVANGFAKLLGPLVAVAGSAYIATKAFEASIEAIYNFEGRLKSAVEKGDVEGAKKVAGERASFEGANVMRGGGATAGAIAGFIFGGPIGAAIGAGLGAAAGTIIANGITAIFGEEALDGLNRLFGGNTRESAVALAAAQAGAVKTQKELDKAQKTATMAMEDFENGSISASEALSRIRAASSEVINQEKRATDFAQKNLENRAGGASGVGRNILSAITFGMVESSSQRNERLGKQSAEQINQAAKFEAQRFQMETGARTATIRSGFARGVDVEEIRNRALGVGTDNDLQKRLAQQVELASTLQDKGDKEGAAAARDSVNQLTAQINQVNREMENLAKEVARAKAAFDAMNLGLRGPIATANAMSASMNKFASGLEVGGSTFVTNTEFLSQAMTSAAQAMDPDQIKSAIKDVSNNLSSMGVDPRKFQANTEAFIQAQQNYNQAFNKIRANIQANREAGRKPGDTPEEIKKAFAAELTAGLGDEAKKNLTAIIENIPLSPEEVDKLLAGDLSVFGDKLSEAGQKQFEEIMKIAQERQKAEQVIIDLTKQRIEAERNLVNAQREAVDLYMEGRDIQAKYGGQAVSTQERRGAILAKANAGAARMGLGQMRTGSVAELRARNNQILTGFGGIEARRSVQGGMQGVEGANAAGTQQDLQQAQKDQVQTIRDLIKLEEEELKIIQEKNRLEKDSLESLISGDIEKFFEQQAAVGAQAAIATGDTSLANMFGASAIGAAFKDIQRMQEAGVQSLFGRQLGGPGGLAEQAAGAALGARGVMDPRMAQRLAGTTAEEEATKGRLRELGGVLGETGAIGAAMAEMQVQTASINVGNATLELQKIEERGRAVAAGMYRGGTVYANRGMFVPRGTDTVPAMLTPGEFVVRREAVNRGNNLQLLRAINSGGNAGGFARGGKVGYYNNGGIVQYKALGDLIARAGQAIGIDPKIITNLGNVFTSFTNSFNESIKNLQNTKLQIKLDSVNVNVNLNGTSMLTQISEQTRKEIVGQVIDKLKNEYGVGNNGKLTQNTSNLPKMA